MKRIVLIAVACVFVATPALANLVVTYDLADAVLNFTQSTNTLKVTQTDDSDLRMKLIDDVSYATLDSALAGGGANFDFELVLKMVDEAGINNWSASGDLLFTDTDGGAGGVNAHVESDSITIADDYLTIAGHLSNIGANPSILMTTNPGDPWKFHGNGSNPTPGADGVAQQITVSNPLSYDGGTLVTLRFGVSGALDTFFSTDRFDLTGGEVKGSIVPVPAAVLLGLLGLGAAALKLRKHA
jgi:hypothetical protein